VYVCVHLHTCVVECCVVCVLYEFFNAHDGLKLICIRHLNDNIACTHISL